MNKTWLRRMIWSYIPIFFAIFSFLLLLCFQTLAEQNKHNAKSSSAVFNGQLLQSIDVSLKSVDYAVIREMLNNKRFAAFFDERDSSDVFLNYEVAKQLTALQKEIPLIDSYYLVRYSDGLIYNGNLTRREGDFEDLPFIREVRESKRTFAWTGFRPFREFSFQKPRRVVSLVHPFPVGSGTEGLFIVNISAASLQELVHSMYDRGNAFVNVYDGAGQPLFGAADGYASGNVLASTSSLYTGWKVESGVRSALLGTLSRTSSVWLFLGFALFLAGLAAIVCVTRRHYKPLEDLVARVRSRLAEERTPQVGDKPPSDEFAFIDSAIDNFAEQTRRFKKEYEEAAVHKRINFFADLGAGGGHLPAYRDSLPFPPHERLQAVVLEIDNPEQVFFRYSEPDQSSFKYVLSSVLNESIRPGLSGVWLEWTSPLQLTGLLFLNDSEPDLKEVGEGVVRWIGKNLPFTATIGIGGTAGTLDEAARSCREAHDSLKFKAVLGGGRVLLYSDARHAARETNRHLRAIHGLVQSILQQDKEWSPHFEGWFEGIRQDCLSRNEIVELGHYFAAHMDWHLSQLARAEYELWLSGALDGAKHAIRSFDTLEELRLSLLRILDAFAAEMAAMRENRRHHKLMKNVRDYLERNYANPELSLDHLSERFAINAKYVSQLFKQEFGENFLDFLAEVRIRHAKAWLMERDAPIQDVGEKVGYANAATFRRVFRRLVGVSPVDYRKRYEPDKNGWADR